MATEPVQSIYSLAKRTGVSASTVSRVLNQREGISIETRSKVLAAAKAAGFRPRMTARQPTVAVVIDRNQFVTFGGYVSSMVSHLVQVLSRHEVAVELVTERNFARLHDRLVDGVLAMAWDDSTIEELRRLPNIPVVALNRMDMKDFSSVATDHRRQAEMAVEYLHGRGHRRLAMLCEERNNWGSNQRVEGFTAALNKAGLPVDDRCVAYTDHQPMYGVLRRLVNDFCPTAIFVAGEDMGLEASYILSGMLGLSIPQDISLLGMESAKVSQFLTPPMTTLSQPLDDLAVRAMELLMRQVGKGRTQSERVMLECTLIERESVAAPPAVDSKAQQTQ